MLIEAYELTKSFRGRPAVAGVSFTVGAGSIVGFLGANGAGKSTTMRMLAGYLGADSGTARIAGFDVARAPLEARARLGYLPEAAAGFAELTVLELLTFAAEARNFRGGDVSRAIERASELTGLGEAMDRIIGTLSKGWRQRAWLAQAVLHDPPVLILDEPTDGLDPLQKAHLRGVLAEMGRSKAILMSTHILEEAEQLCDRLIVIAAGRIVADAPRVELADGDGRLAPAFARLVAGAAEQVAP
jgi:ABC-2 type transport system ATP-binding protein